jgi:hypothetical protein
MVFNPSKPKLVCMIFKYAVPTAQETQHDSIM